MKAIINAVLGIILEIFFASLILCSGFLLSWLITLASCLPAGR